MQTLQQELNLISHSCISPKMRTLPDYADNDDSVVASVSNSDLVAKV